MIKPISDFASRFGTKISLDETLIVKRHHGYFLLNGNLKRLTIKDFFCAGTYLGKTKGEEFFPGFNLLDIIAHENANRIVIDNKTEWLFICGRDIFKQGIMKVIGSKKKDDYSLVLNSHGECLGFGRILRNLDGKRTGLAVENVLDIGDFLRREK